MNVDELLRVMTSSAEDVLTGTLESARTYMLPELKKIAVQIDTIVRNRDDYTEEGARLLLELQLDATAAVIVAMTELTLIEIQTALNAILGAVRELVNGAIGFVLI